MTVEEPSGFELMRTLEAMRADQRSATDALNTRLDGLVSERGLNEIIRRLDGTDNTNSAHIAKLDTKVDAEIKTLTQNVERRFTQLTNRIWFVLAVIILPVSFYLVSWLRGTP